MSDLIKNTLVESQTRSAGKRSVILAGCWCKHENHLANHLSVWIQLQGQQPNWFPTKGRLGLCLGGRLLLVAKNELK